MTDKLFFPLSTPVKTVLSGVHGPRREEVIDGVTLRPLSAKDLTLLEQHKGMPASLALYGTAAMSGLAIGKVRRIAIDDYAPIASEVLRRFADACARVGIRPEYFIPPESCA